VVCIGGDEVKSGVVEAKNQAAGGVTKDSAVLGR
jgi:hypothetical protein